MNTQQAQQIASDKIRIKYKQSIALKLLHRYAVVELRKTKDANEFALSFEKKDPINENDQNELNHFFTWYYLNYIATNKNGLLTTETAINFAFFHFLELPEEPAQKRFIETYAKEELGLSDEDAKNYSSNIISQGASIQVEDQFFLWYFINHLSRRPEI